MRKTLPALLLLCALLLCACGTQSEEPYSLTLWYVEDDPLAPVFLRLAEDYNRERERDSLAVTTRAWTNEELLLRALESGASPGLVLCSHELAFHLYEQERLYDPKLAVIDCPAWLRERSDCVGHGFFPIGSELPLLCVRNGFPTTLGALLAEGSGEWESAQPLLAVERFAPLFYQVLLDAGTEFTATARRDELSLDYVNFYNALAGLAFEHVLSAAPEAAAPCRIASSPALRDRELNGCGVYPLSDGPLLATCRGLALTARDTRMQRALPDFLRWLAGSARLGQAALEAGLIPAGEESLRADSPLEATLLSLRERSQHLPDAGCSYYVNQSFFEEEFRAALELLH